MRRMTSGGIDNRPQRDVGIRKNSVFSFESTLFSYLLRLLIPFLAVNADIAECVAVLDVDVEIEIKVAGGAC